MERHAPQGMAAAGEVGAMCERGACFVASVDGSEMVYVLQLRGRLAWVSVAAGGGAADLTRATLPAIEAQVSAECDSLGFITARPGLVKKARALGYEVRGWVLSKDLK